MGAVIAYAVDQLYAIMFLLIRFVPFLIQHLPL